MRNALAACGFAACSVVFSPAPVSAAESFRPPAVPLVVHDPYFCVWSAADRLADEWPRHWTGRRHALSSLARIDGKTYRLMGPEPAGAPALPQARVEVLPTRTVYEFKGGEVQLGLTFLTPALPDDLDLLARPLTYLTWEARSLDGKPHAVSVYFEASSELAVNRAGQMVVASAEEAGDLAVLRAGTKDQPVLAKRGDDLRIDWGYLYAAAPRGESLQRAIVAGGAGRDAFAAGRNLPEAGGAPDPRPAGDEGPALAFAFDLGQVGAEPRSRFLMLAYDDLYSIRYMGRKLRPYWRRKGAEARDLLRQAAAERPALDARSRAFDEELLSDLRKAGGEKYARLSALAYRQCLAGNKLAADANGLPLFFPKENFSNGCIATVDVIYPMAPLFLLFGPAMTRATLVPVLDYGRSPRWKHPFAPHDLGTYPHAEGQVYGGGERTEVDQMPVEESANLLLLVAAVARMEGDARFAAPYWNALSRWAEYLKAKGLDPENQLSTDDFAGHLAHNVNLSAKAILALGAYAQLAGLAGKKEESTSYRRTAEEFAAEWMRNAADGDHYRLAFDKPGTWSQKYNLIWDRILGLRLFPEEVARKELAFYRKTQNRYGLPLDNRKEFTKLDWILWTASLTGSREDFDALVDPAYDFLCQTPDRVPMTDWYWTGNAKVAGFRARPVVGAVFIKLLDDPAVWKKWAGRGARVSGEWAPLPEPPKVNVLAATSRDEPVRWRYTFTRPPEGWSRPGFDDSGWQEGPGGFGTRQTPGAVVRTEWSSQEIWLRREITVPEGGPGELQLFVHHDEDVEAHLNGVPAAEEGGFTTSYQLLPLNAAGRAALKPGKNLLALHCRQTRGGQYIDAGLVAVEP
jgi:hypothetical protein